MELEGAFFTGLSEKVSCNKGEMRLEEAFFTGLLVSYNEGEMWVEEGSKCEG